MPQILDIRPEVKTDSSAASALGDFQEELQTSVGPAIAQIRNGVLHYAGPQQAGIAQPALFVPFRVKPRGFRADWYGLGVLALTLSSAAVCVYRLIWATQP